MKSKKPKKLQPVKKQKSKDSNFKELMSATSNTLEALINFVFNVEKRLFLLEKLCELLEKQQKEINKKLDNKK